MGKAYKVGCMEKVCVITNEMYDIIFFKDMSKEPLKGIPQSHGFSYMAMRDRYKSKGKIMGLDNQELLKEYQIKHNVRENSLVETIRELIVRLNSQEEIPQLDYFPIPNSSNVESMYDY